MEIKKANSIGGLEPPDLIISITEQAKTDNLSLPECRLFYNKEGKRLSDALFASLPGGTIDALLCEMMTRRASLFVVPFSGE